MPGRDLQNTAVVVGDHAAELESVDVIILERKVFATNSQGQQLLFLFNFA